MNIRAIRQAQKLTINELAERGNFQAPYLSLFKTLENKMWTILECC